MHWIQSIRQHLQLSQRDLAVYLGVSVDLIKSVEGGRRQLPLTSLQPAMTLFQVITESQSRNASVRSRLTKTDHHARRNKLLHIQYRKKLFQCEGNLENIQLAHATASINLGIYQHLALSLAGDEDAARKTWVHKRIEEWTEKVEDNDEEAQQPLQAQVDALKEVMLALEETFEETTPQMTLHHGNRSDQGI